MPVRVGDTSTAITDTELPKMLATYARPPSGVIANRDRIPADRDGVLDDRGGGDIDHRHRAGILAGGVCAGTVRGEAWSKSPSGAQACTSVGMGAGV
ncbi:hypothetical protein GA0061093_11759 [Rhodococcus qingshengii]|nr:hypothetical protein GA0061093_11759 [Rhodococcus qingshengii]